MRRWGVMAAVTLSVAAGASPAQASFPGRNGDLARVPNDNAKYGGDSRIGLVHPNGGGFHELPCVAASPFGVCSDTDPAFSPRGGAIALSAGYGQTQQIQIVNTDGSNPRPVAGTIAAHNPSWSPDARRLAFSIADDGVYTIGLDGSDRRKVADGGRDPSWSTTGWIAFQRENDLYRVREDGSGLKRLTYRGGTRPNWSPDGRRITFGRSWLYPDLDRVYVMRADGKRLRRLTRRNGDTPVWSPDGRAIAFRRSLSSGGDAGQSGPREIYTIHTDGRRLRRVGSAGFGSFLDWQSRH